MNLVITVLICVAIILLGATGPRPIGWVALALAVIALLLAVLGGVGFQIGK